MWNNVNKHVCFSVYFMVLIRGPVGFLFTFFFFFNFFLILVWSDKGPEGILTYCTACSSFLQQKSSNLDCSDSICVGLQFEAMMLCLYLYLLSKISL